MNAMNQFVVLFIVAYASCCVVAVDNHYEARNNSEYALKKALVIEEIKRDWTIMKNFVDVMLNTLGKLLYSEAIKLGTGNTTINISCQRSLLKWFTGIKRSKSWAIKMLDAWGKPAGGILRGTLTWIGSYEECMEVFKGRTLGKNDFVSHYCPLDVWLPMPDRKPFYTAYEVPSEIDIFPKDHMMTDLIEYSMFFHMIPVRIGMCVPSTCKPEDITEILESVSIFDKKSRFKVNVLECQAETAVKFSSLQIGIMNLLDFQMLFRQRGHISLSDFLWTTYAEFHTQTCAAIVIFGVLVLIGTVIDTWQTPTLTSERATWCRVLVTFSAYTNTRKLFNTDLNEDTLGFFHGLRFLSVVWVILCHTYLYSQYRFFKGATYYRQTLGFLYSNFINNGFLSVETFFFMSSFLAAYWRTKNQHITFSIPLYILHRLWRILPAYLLTLGLLFLSPISGSGPVWKEVMDLLVEPCKKHWWTNILFINNFVHVDDICLEPSWYLATEMQLYILFLVVLLPLPRWPKAAMFVNFFLLVLSIGATALVNLYKGLPPTGLLFYPDPRDRNKFAHEQYFKPYTHVCSYCVGMAAGYLMATSPKMKIKKLVRVLLWCISFSTMAFVVFIIREWNLGHHMGLIESTIYAALHRFLWITSLAWIVVNCCTGTGGIVNTFLCWKAFVPLSRLSFMIYLIHPIIQWMFIGNTRERVVGQHITFIYWFLGHITISLFAGYFCTLLTESPFMNLEKLLLMSKTKEHHSPKDQKQPNELSNGVPNDETDASIRL